MTQYVALLCHSLGYKTAVISRGYKGSAEKQGGIVSDGRALRMTAKEAGDEPFLMAAHLPDIPVLVGRDRFAVGMRAVKEFGPDVIVLDDAFQHLQLARDIDLVLLDRSRPVGNGRLLPRGPLREPVSSLSRGDAFIFTRSDHTDIVSDPQLEKYLGGKPLFQTTHQPFIAAVVHGGTEMTADRDSRPETLRMTDLQNRRVFLFSGIARNKDFQKSVSLHGAEIRDALAFKDHYCYSTADLGRIKNAAVAAQAELIVTTEKDFARIDSRMDWPMDLWAIGIRLTFPDQTNGFEAFIRRKLDAAHNLQQTDTK